ncbi:MAG: Rieske 2Fe-2S domain-containing protein [Rhodospirillaceae bacterium]|nr:Rieske 2Fe-2S domain-containing protein [Rhodospirillaceae bacterium]
MTANKVKARADLVEACSLRELEAATGALIYKNGAKQIAIFQSETGIYACNNRCPHEGYPLKVGTLSEGCVLTCNWHNWKFNLETGETLVGGDQLRRYPVTIRDGAVWLDLTEPPTAQRIAGSINSLKEAFEDYDYDRMARELARLELAGAAPMEGLRQVLRWSHDRFEFGMSHAQAATADWLTLRDDRGRGRTKKLIPMLEAVAHFAYDTLREQPYPYPKAVRKFQPDRLVGAIEAEDEAAAIGQIRGALKAGLGFDALERPLTEAALAHFQGFGHAIIYVYKTRLLAERLGAGMLEVLLLPLVRGLIYSRREDLIPEFRNYAPSLAAWDGSGDAIVTADDFKGLSINRALSLANTTSGDTAALYDALFGPLAWNLLHFDLTMEYRTDNPISRNIGWLDFTHGLTFANAVRTQCERHPHLWPQGLLQMACFVGRNAGFVDHDLAVAEWRVDDAKAFLETTLDSLFDHGEIEHIVACHYLKTTYATYQEVRNAPRAQWVPTLAAAINRLVNSPLKRRHLARTAHQALSFVASEG